MCREAKPSADGAEDKGGSPSKLLRNLTWYATKEA
jgi:hypothetical protein